MKQYIKQWLSLCCAVALLCVAIPFAPAASAAATTIFYEGFEGSSLPSGWSTFDADNDGYGWEWDTNIYNGYPSTGHCMYSTSALSWSHYLTPDDWLMMPAVTLPDSVEADYELSFQIYTSYMTGYTDYIQVYAFTSPITDPAALTEAELILDESYYTGSEYNKMTVDITSFRSQTVYLAFRHHKANGVWQMYLDDVTILAKEPDTYRVKVTGNTAAYTVVPATGSFEALADRDYMFTVNVNEAYKNKNAALTVTANGNVLTPENGVYTIPAVTEKQTLEIVYAYDDGDMNGDGKIAMVDAMTLYRSVAGLTTLNAVQQQSALIDVNDGVSMSDALLLYSFVSGKREYLNVNENIGLIWQRSYVDTANGLSSQSDIKSATYIYNNQVNRDFAVDPSYGDVKQIFYTDKAARVVNLADAYALTLPFTDFKTDYSLGELRSRYESDTMVLNISKEDKNPYGNTANGWNIYLTEWLNRFVSDDSFLSANNIERTHNTVQSTSLLSGYTVLNYDLYIENDGNIAMPYYHIAVIRKNTEYVNFYLLVMKSDTDQSAAMNAIVRSFKEIYGVGEAKNTQGSYECEVPDYWNDETKAYYNKLLTQDSTDWGFFSASMTYKGASDYSYQDSRIQEEYDRLSISLDYDYEIMPTYTHIGYGNTMHSFPLDQALKFAGGNGFNGKPVLQMSYQFTTSNNTALNRYTPMFDILRGEYDEQFRALARDIKSYGAPVLFRLNNEMNTDWTSYAGIVTLLDPDVFVMTWERLYDIFLEEGVDNCIWIFNPIADTTPYCNWGEYLCYMPDVDCVQALGLTSYEMGNGATLRSFEDRYRALYEKNTPYFEEYPWIISEFGCGAGGAAVYNYSTGSWNKTTLGRNAAAQAAWVENMFECFSHRTEKGYEFCDRIKGAVWFSCNDYASVDGVNTVTNYFKLEDELTLTMKALKNGLAAEQ